MQAATTAIEQFERHVEAGTPAAVVIRPIAVHHFASTGEAYDACQCYEAIKRGDVLVIESEGVVGVAYTWPFAITPEAGELHQLGPDAGGVRAEFADSIKVAEAEAAKLTGTTDHADDTDTPETRAYGLKLLAEAGEQKPEWATDADWQAARQANGQAAPYGYTYQDYMARLSAVLTAAAPGAVLVVGPELGAALLNGKPVWFDLADGIENAADFDISAWDGANGCWDGETHAKTWGALEKRTFA